MDDRGERRDETRDTGRRSYDTEFLLLRVELEHFEEQQNKRHAVNRQNRMVDVRRYRKYAKAFSKRVKDAESRIEKIELYFGLLKWGGVVACVILGGVFSSLVYFIGDRVRALLIATGIP